jgi:hypothetical protein
MIETEKINLTKEELKNLPIFLRKIYCNTITDIAVENKLYRYNPTIQDNLMRSAFPPKMLSKIYIPKTLKDESE